MDVLMTANDENHKLAVSPRQVKKYGGPGPTKVYALINNGELPAHKMGARTYILMTDLLAWLKR